jgi:hypothetical protein
VTSDLNASSHHEHTLCLLDIKEKVHPRHFGND